jgi:hypothetical protein
MIRETIRNACRTVDPGEKQIQKHSPRRHFGPGEKQKQKQVFGFSPCPLCRRG